MLRAVLVAVVFAMATGVRADELERPAVRDPARPAIGEWIGAVSWNDPPVNYSWAIFPDGTFTSGRSGRGHDGGGAWGMHGGELILKYEDGFRYEGALSDDGYGGTAYTADGRAFGTFSMSRASEAAVIEEAP
jgi:hypothetical protein